MERQGGCLLLGGESLDDDDDGGAEEAAKGLRARAVKGPDRDRVAARVAGELDNEQEKDIMLAEPPGRGPARGAMPRGATRP